MNIDEAPRSIPASEAPAGSAATTRGGWLPGAVALLLVAIADWLFFGHVTGWTIGGYGLALLLAIQATAPSSRPEPARLVLLLLTAGLAVRCVVEPTLLATVLLPLGLLTYALALREGWTDSLLIWICRWCDSLSSGLVRAWSRLLPASARAIRLSAGHGLRRTLANWAIPLALGSVFVALFSAANPVVHRVLAAAWNLLTLPDVSAVDLPRVLFWVLAFTLLRILLAHRTGCVASPGADAVPVATPDDLAFIERLLPPATVVRALAVFNAVFAVQTVLDLFYLWGGARLPQGMSHADYAHRGAYPLVAAALLAGAFVLLVFRGDAHQQHSTARLRLLYAWLAQTLLLVASSVWRLGLYVDAYGLTRLRLVAAVWMVLVAVGLILIVLRIARARSARWLVRANTAALGLALYLMALGGIDAFVARFNVQRCQEVLGAGHAELDVEYLRTLRSDALPGLLWIQTRMPDHANAHEWLDAIDEMSRALEYRMRDWRGWTFQRAVAMDDLIRWRAGRAREERPPAVRPNLPAMTNTQTLPATTPAPEAVAATFTPPAVQPTATVTIATVTSVLHVCTGRVSVMRAGRLELREPLPGASGTTTRTYRVFRSAALHGLASLSDLQLDQRVTYRYRVIDGVPTIVELAGPRTNLPPPTRTGESTP